MADNEQFRNPSPPPDVARNPSPPPEVEQNVPQEASLNSEEVSSEASKGAVNGTLQNSSSFSNVSSSYQKLQSGIDDIKAKTDVSDAPKQNTEKKVKEDKEFIEIVDDEKPKKEKSKSKMRRADSSASSSDDDDGDYEWRKDMLPDRSKSDYYCELCDAHMNSEQMWENHVQGKRHLKNLKKEPGEPPSKVRAVKQDCTPKIQRKIDKVEDPVVGLDYICELQRSEPFLDPTYTCFLCHSTCMASTIIDHILGAKHRLAYLKAVDPDAYALVENMKMKKSGLTALAEERAAELEAKEGRGQMEVKLEKPKLAPPPPKREKRYLDDDRERDYYGPYKRPAGIDSDFRRDRWSPEPPMPPPPPMNAGFALPANVHSLPMHVKLDLLDQLSTLVVVSDNEAKALMRIINSLTQSLLQFKIRNLPPGLQDMLAKHIISGDTRGLENALGLGNTGMANVGNMLNSMAAAGELPEPRGALGGPPPPWGPGGSGRGRGGMGRGGENVWGSPGRGGFSGGMNPVPFGGPHWHGMGNSGFRSGDRASQGY